MPDSSNHSHDVMGTYVFDEGTLVLEGVTLGEVVELVVKVLVNLSGGTVLDEETAEHTEAAHPEDLAIPNQQLAQWTPQLF